MSNSDLPWRERAGLSVEEVAAILSVGRTTAWQLVQDGTLASFKVGRLRRVLPASVVKLASEKTHNQAERDAA